MLSVCNGAFFLAKAGLLDGLEATTFAGMIDDLQAAAPKTKVVARQAVRRQRQDHHGRRPLLGDRRRAARHREALRQGRGPGRGRRHGVRLASRLRLGAGEPRRPAPLSGLRRGQRVLRARVVRHEGTRDRWETSWKIRPTARAEPCSTQSTRAVLGTGLDAARRPGESQSRWRFRDGDGSAWTETTRVEADAGQEEKGYQVTMTVARAAGR